jgi:hypothetical protein
MMEIIDGYIGDVIGFDTNAFWIAILYQRSSGRLQCFYLFSQASKLKSSDKQPNLLWSALILKTYNSNRHDRNSS